jgi:hypothetical protein
MGKEAQKVLYKFMFTLFQTYEFKQALAMSYVSNLHILIENVFQDGKSLLNLGVQVLTIDTIVLQII